MNSLIAANIAANNARRRNRDEENVALNNTCKRQNNENDVKYAEIIIYFLLWTIPYIAVITIAAFKCGCF